MTSVVGFIGLGNMGLPMARRLAAEHELLVHDLDTDTVTGLSEEFSSVEPVTPESFATCEVAILMLPTSAIVEATIHGPHQLFTRLPSGAVVVDMGSSEPLSTVALAEEAARHGITYVDAPVSGGVTRATSGELSIMVGGDALGAARPVLERLGTSIVHVGPVGSAHAAKSLNNLLSATGLMAAAEVMLVATKFGIEPEAMLAVLNGGTGSNNSTEKKFTQFILSRRFDSGFGAGLMMKDLGIAVGLAEQTGTTLEVTRAAYDLCARATESLGPTSDQTALVTFLEQAAGAALTARSDAQV